MSKKNIAVFFGGRSPEHDVSIVTALQVIAALRTDRYESTPVYVNREGKWFTGDQLRDRAFYLPSVETEKKLLPVTLGNSHSGRGVLQTERRLLRGGSDIEFDVAIPAFHGIYGEDGCFQGVMEFAQIPYVGMRHLASAVAMDKVATKSLVAARTAVQQLPYRTFLKQDCSNNVPELAGFEFPLIVKPAHLGSSIGVAKANDEPEVAAALASIFTYDSKAIAEPFISSRREYNVAVRRAGKQIVTSAIERPKSTAELLDFREKYLSGGAKKIAGSASEGMLSLTRDINPAIDPSLENQIRSAAISIFAAFEGTGIPRLDFIEDVDTGRLWFNEVNPCPGSFGHFLWEAAGSGSLLFSELLDTIIEEAIELQRAAELPSDPVPRDAQLFRRF